MFKIDRLSRRMFLVNAGLGPGGAGSSGGQANDGGAGAGGMNDAGANDARAGRDNYGGEQKGWGSGAGSVVSQGATHDSWRAKEGGLSTAAQTDTAQAQKASQIVDRGPSMTQKVLGKVADGVVGFFGGPITSALNQVGVRGATGRTVGGHVTNTLHGAEISNTLNPSAQSGINANSGSSPAQGNDYSEPGILNTGQPGDQSTPTQPPPGGVETPEAQLYASNRIKSVARGSRYV